MPAEAIPEDELPLDRRASTVLHWLLIEQAGPLARAGYRPRRIKDERPVPAVSALLADGVVLAEVLVALDALPHASVLRAVRRPASTPDGAHTVDARQTQQQYRHNTRRVVHAIRKIMEHLRGAPLPTGLMHAYMGADVANTPPRSNPAPAVRLVELVIAAAMYGPRSDHFVWGIWHMPCDETKRTLHAIVANIASYFNLAPFERIVAQVSNAYPSATSALLENDDNIGDRKLSLVTDDGKPLIDQPAHRALPAVAPPHSPQSQHDTPSPVQLTHPDHHDFRPSNNSELGQDSDDPELMSHKYAYNEANARLQEVARTRALFTRLEGSVRGSRVLYSKNKATATGGPAEPPPNFNMPLYSPLPEFTNFEVKHPRQSAIPSSLLRAQPPPASLPSLDSLGRRLDKVGIEPYPDVPVATLTGCDPKDTEFSSDEDEETAAAARRVSVTSDGSGTIPSLPIFPAAVLQGTVPPMSGISPPDLGTPDIIGDAVAFAGEELPAAVAGPSSKAQDLHSSKLEVTSRPSKGSTGISAPSGARSSIDGLSERTRHGRGGAFAISTSRLTNADEDEIVENEVLVTDEDEEVTEYVEGDEDLFTSTVTAPARSSDDIQTAATALVGQRDSNQSSPSIQQYGANQESHAPPTTTANTASSTLRPATNISTRALPLLDEPSEQAHPEASNTLSPYEQQGRPHSTSATITKPVKPRSSSLPSAAADSMAPPPVQPAPVITQPFAASWLPVDAPVASSSERDSTLRRSDSGRTSPSPLPPLFLTSQRMREENLSRAAAGMRLPSPTAAPPPPSGNFPELPARESRTATPPPETNSAVARIIQQYNSPSQTGHPINFPYGTSSGASGMASPTPAMMVTLPPSKNNAPSPTYLVHTLPLENVLSPRAPVPSSHVANPAYVSAHEQSRSAMQIAPSINLLSKSHSSPEKSAHSSSQSEKTKSAVSREVMHSDTRDSVSSASDSEVDASLEGDVSEELQSSSSGSYADAIGSSHSSGEDEIVEVASARPDIAQPQTPLTPQFDADRCPLPYVPGLYTARATAGRVPSTPPSPPAISDVVASFAVKTPDRPRHRTRPVSTMSPSPKLFQKLISVWQSSADTGAASTDPTPTPSPIVHSDRALEESKKSNTNVPKPSTSTDKMEGSTLQAPEDSPSDDSGVSTPEVQQLDIASAKSHTRGARRLAVRLTKSPVQQAPKRSEEPVIESRFQDAVKEISPAEKSKPVKSEAAPQTSLIKPDDHWRRPKVAENSESDTTQTKRSLVLPSATDPSSSVITTSTSSVPRRVISTDTSAVFTDTQEQQRLSQQSQHSMSPTFETGDRASSASVDGIQVQGETVRVDKRRLDWLTQELLAARDAINEKHLELHIAEKDTTDEKEVLILEKQDAESVVSAMKQILAERESELREARRRLSIAISGVSRTKSKRISKDTPSKTPAEIEAEITAKAVKMAEAFYNERSGELQKHKAKASQGINISEFLARFDQSDDLTRELADRSNDEMSRLWGEVQTSMEEKMMRMVDVRDKELSEMKVELGKRQKAMEDLQEARLKLVDQNAHIQAEATSAKQERELIITQAAMEISQVQAQLVLVDKFSKKLHDTFKETEMLRVQVADSQAKMASFASHSGISARQAKELREAVLRAQSEADRWRQVAETTKTEKREAEHRAEEMGRLYKSAAQPAAHGRFGAANEDDAFSSEHSFDQQQPSSGRRTGTSSKEQTRGVRLPTNDASTGSRVLNLIKNMVTLGNGEKGQKASNRKPPRKPRENRRHPQQQARRQQLQLPPNTGHRSDEPYRSPNLSPRDFQESYRVAAGIPSPPGSHYSGQSGPSVGEYSAHSGQSGSRNGTPIQPPQPSGSGRAQSPEFGPYSRHGAVDPLQEYNSY